MPDLLDRMLYEATREGAGSTINVHVSKRDDGAVALAFNTLPTGHPDCMNEGFYVAGTVEWAQALQDLLVKAIQLDPTQRPASEKDDA